MSETKIVVPDGMMKAAEGATRNLTTGQWVILRDGLEAALLWLSENPLEPTKEQVRELVMIAPDSKARQEYSATIFCISEWQRRMFLAPESKAPKDIEDMLAEEIQYPNIPLQIPREQ